MERSVNLKNYYIMKKLLILGVLAMSMAAAGCSAAFYSSAGAYDDLYATHDTNAIAARQKAEAEARKAEAEARRAEAAAAQAQWEAEVAKYQAAAAAQNNTAQAAYRTDADGIIIVDDPTYVSYESNYNPYQGYVADSYESAYARRLRGFHSATYRMPSSYFNLRYGGSFSYVTAYDPGYYNIMVSGDQVWVEPKYITSMFGTWGATNATAMIYSPWYYGWSGYDPWYNSWWGYPHYSWYDWNWNICYGGGWGVNLWWGWGGHYHPWRPYYGPHWGWHGPHYVHHHGPHYGHPHYGHNYRDNRYYGSRGNNHRIDGGHYAPSRGGDRGTINRGSGRVTPYRSPSNGNVYGQSGSRTGNSAATVNNSTQNRTPGSVSRGSGSAARGNSSAVRGSGSSGSSRGTITTPSNSNNRGGHKKSRTTILVPPKSISQSFGNSINKSFINSPLGVNPP